MQFRFRQSLASNAKCPQAVKYAIEEHVDKKTCEKEGRIHIPTGQTSTAAQFGIDMHSVVEAYLLAVKAKDAGAMDKIAAQLPQQLLDYLCENEIHFSHIEHDLEWDEPGFSASGRIDAIGLDGYIYDWKFPQSPWNQSKFEQYGFVQGYWYMFLVQTCMPDVNLNGFRYIVIPPDPRDFSVWTLEVDADAISQAASRARSLYAQWEHNYKYDGWRANPSMWNCRFCFYKGVCPSKVGK